MTLNLDVGTVCGVAALGISIFTYCRSQYPKAKLTACTGLVMSEFNPSAPDHSEGLMVEIESAGAPIHDPTVTLLLLHGRAGTTYLEFRPLDGRPQVPMERGQRRMFFLSKAAVAEKFRTRPDAPSTLLEFPARAWRLQVRGSGRELQRRRPWRFQRQLKWLDWRTPSAFA
jgi:hypothetical protein